MEVKEKYLKMKY